MDLYLAICIDVWAKNPVVRVFDTNEHAAEFAKEFVVENALYRDEIVEKNVNGYCRYEWTGFFSSSPEIRAYVEKAELNKGSNRITLEQAVEWGLKHWDHL